MNWTNSGHNFYQSKAKANFRNEIFKAVNLSRWHSQKQKFFTLVGDALNKLGESSLEHRLLKEFPKADIHTVEQNSLIRDQILDYLDKSPPNFNLYLSDRRSDLTFFKKAARRKDKFGMIWLDYCGHWSTNKQRTLEVLFKNQMFDLPDAILALTIRCGRENSLNGVGFSDLEVQLEEEIRKGIRIPIYKVNSKSKVLPDMVDDSINVRLFPIHRFIDNLAQEANIGTYLQVYTYISEGGSRMLTFLYSLIPNYYRYQSISHVMEL